MDKIYNPKTTSWPDGASSPSPPLGGGRVGLLLLFLLSAAFSCFVRAQGSLHGTEVRLLINGSEHPVTVPYVVDCDHPGTALAVNIETASGAVLSIAPEFGFVAPGPSVSRIGFSVISSDGQRKKEYVLTVETRFAFWDIVVQRWGNTLGIINNPDNNGGYRFRSCRWYRNGRLAGYGLYHSIDADGLRFTRGDIFYAVLVTEQGDTLRTCGGVPYPKEQGPRAWPNPVRQGNALYVETGDTQPTLVEVFNNLGKCIGRRQVSEPLITLDLPDRPGIYFIRLVRNGVSETVKVAVGD